MEKNAQHTPCIEWTGRKDRDGYGRVSHNGRWRGAHRVAYERAFGPISDGLVIDHLCRNRACVNPDHMELVTSCENTQRGYHATKLNCERGHPLTGENLRLDSRGNRQCKQCGRDRWNAYRARKIQAGTWAHGARAKVGA